MPINIIAIEQDVLKCRTCGNETKFTAVTIPGVSARRHKLRAVTCNMCDTTLDLTADGERDQ